MSRRRKILVPEAREGLDRLKAQFMNVENPNEAKYEAAKEKDIPLNHTYNGQLTTKDAGKIGGNMGGRMVKELVRMAQEEMTKRK